MVCSPWYVTVVAAMCRVIWNVVTVPQLFGFFAKVSGNKY